MSEVIDRVLNNKPDVEDGELVSVSSLPGPISKKPRIKSMPTLTEKKTKPTIKQEMLSTPNQTSR